MDIILQSYIICQNNVETFRFRMEPNCFSDMVIREAGIRQRCAHQLVFQCWVEYELL